MIFLLDQPYHNRIWKFAFIKVRMSNISEFDRLPSGQSGGISSRIQASRQHIFADLSTLKVGLLI
jgi:hypothetical protein